jgi:DnaJ-domain-containing protein 1
MEVPFEPPLPDFGTSIHSLKKQFYDDVMVLCRMERAAAAARSPGFSEISSHVPFYTSARSRATARRFNLARADLPGNSRLWLLCLAILELAAGVRGDFLKRASTSRSAYIWRRCWGVVATENVSLNDSLKPARRSQTMRLSGGGAKLHPLSYPWLSMSFKDPNYYQILGVPENAPLQQVKEVYRRSIMSHHPDREGIGGEDNFIAVQQAWEVHTHFPNARKRSGSLRPDCKYIGDRHGPRAYPTAAAAPLVCAAGMRRWACAAAALCPPRGPCRVAAHTLRAARGIHPAPQTNGRPQVLGDPDARAAYDTYLADKRQLPFARAARAGALAPGPTTRRM